MPLSQRNVEDFHQVDDAVKGTVLFTIRGIVDDNKPSTSDNDACFCRDGQYYADGVHPLVNDKTA